MSDSKHTTDKSQQSIVSAPSTGYTFGFFPGEEAAIQRVVACGAEYGYGNTISHLKRAWSDHLQAQGINKQGADMAAGIICVWCHTDSRNGKKV